jgi:Flp pilus assembly protein TadD
MTNDSLPMPEDATAARRAVEAEPHNANAYYNLGFLLARDPAQVNEAEAALRQAIELEPNNARYVYRLGLVLQEKLHRFEKAEIAYRRALELAPDDPYYYSGLVNLLVQQSRRGEVLTLAETMRSLLNVGEHWYGLAVLDAILGNVDVALDHLRKAARQENFPREWARIDPDLDSIRADPRFDEIVGSL